MSSAGGRAAGAARASFTRNPYWAAQRKSRAQLKQFHRARALAGGGTTYDNKPLKLAQSWPIVSGDLVQVTSTSRKRDKENKGKWMKNADGSWMAEDWLGAQGKVLRVMRATGQVIVEGVNMKTRIAQPTADATGHFYKLESPIPYEQVSLVDPTTHQAVKGLKVSKGPVRIAAETGAEIPRPRYAAFLQGTKDPLSRQARTANPLTDTSVEHVLAVTYRKPTITKPVLRSAEEQAADPEAPLTHPEDIELRVARIKF